MCVRVDVHLCVMCVSVCHVCICVSCVHLCVMCVSVCHVCICVSCVYLCVMCASVCHVCICVSCMRVLKTKISSTHDYSYIAS